MSKPRMETNNSRYIKDTHFLYEVLAVFRTSEEQKMFLKDILTSSELRMLKKRWHIANLLSQGKDIRTVARMAKTSTQTVSKVKSKMEEGNGGYAIAIERVTKFIEKQRKSKLAGSSKFVKTWFK